MYVKEVVNVGNVVFVVCGMKPVPHHVPFSNTLQIVLDKSCTLYYYINRYLLTEVIEVDFKTIPSFPSYEISINGVVRNISTGNILSHSINAWGNHNVAIFVEGSKPPKHTSKAVTKLVAEVYLDYDPSTNARISFRDNNPSNLHADNLQISTKGNQMREQFRNGRVPAGPEGDPIKIYRASSGLLLGYAVSTNAAAQITGVSQTSISLIINGKYENNSCKGFIFKREDSNE